MILASQFSENFKSRITIKFLIILFIISFDTMNSYGFADSTDIYKYDLNQLSKLKISSVSKSPIKISETPVTVHIVSAEEIKEKGYLTLEDVLGDLPGFQFRNIQSFNTYSFQRGIPNQNNLILVLIDGIQVNELNSGGFYGGGLYNLSNIDRIEVIYGPGSVAYGTNAVTGIINIISKTSLENRTIINAGAGSFNTINADASYSYANEKKDFGIRLSAMVKKTDKTDLKGSAGDNNWTDLLDNFENNYSFGLKIQVDNFTFGSHYLQKQSSTAPNVKSAGTDYKDYGTLWNVQFLNNYIKYNKKFNEKWTISTTLYNRNANVLDNTVQYVLDTTQIGYYRPNYLIGLENIASYVASDFITITGGIVFEYEELANGFSITYSNDGSTKPPTPKKPPMTADRLIGIFLEPQINILQNLFLLCGVRYDQSSLYDKVLTPRAGISYNLDNQILRLSYSEAFRAPKPWDYTDGLGNESLIPETMKSFEAGITLSLINNFQIDFTAYKNQLKNAINKQTLNNGYRWINEGEINTSGIELELRHATAKIKTTLNYTFTQSLNAYGAFVPEISKHTGNASITYSFYEHLKLNMRANYIGKRENPKLIEATNSIYIEPAFIVNSTLSFYNYKGFDFSLSINNIFDTKYYHTSNRAPDRYKQAARAVLFSVAYSTTN